MRQKEPEVFILKKCIWSISIGGVSVCRQGAAYRERATKSEYCPSERRQHPFHRAPQCGRRHLLHSRYVDCSTHRLHTKFSIFRDGWGANAAIIQERCTLRKGWLKKSNVLTLLFYSRGICFVKVFENSRKIGIIYEYVVCQKVLVRVLLFFPLVPFFIQYFCFRIVFY